MAIEEKCNQTERVTASLQIPKLKKDENDRVILPELDPNVIVHLGIPLVPFSVLQALQARNLHILLDKPQWNVVAGYYGHDFSSDAQELKELAEMKRPSGSVIRKHIKKGMLEAFALLPDEVKVIFTPEEIKQLTASKYRYAQVFLERQRNAVGADSFRARQAKLREDEDPNCPRRQKTRETNARLASDEAFQQTRRDSIRKALAVPETRRKISVALEKEWKDGTRSREDLVAFNQSPATREKRRQRWNTEFMHRRKKQIAESGLRVSPSRYRKIARRIKDIDNIDKLLWQSVCNRQDILEKVFAHAGLSEEEKRRITEYFTSKGDVTRLEPSLFERFSRGVALYG